MSILQRIGQLSRDLLAVIVVQEERGHVESWEKRGKGDEGRNPYVSESDWIIDEPRITKPDMGKREAARKELQQIYDSSKWYQFIRRYFATRTLKSSR